MNQDELEESLRDFFRIFPENRHCFLPRGLNAHPLPCCFRATFVALLLRDATLPRPTRVDPGFGRHLSEKSCWAARATSPPFPTEGGGRGAGCLGLPESNNGDAVRDAPPRPSRNIVL